MRSLETWLALLEQRHPRAIDLGLERCGSVYRRLGSPRPARQVITVAGTNGKGSTVAFLAALNSCSGNRCGSYTSPHILRFNERITIMGEPVSDTDLVRAFEQVEAVRAHVSLTYFEFTTLAALLILQQAVLDFAILEVGLGGRLDTVNLVDTDCAVITPIGLDHQDFLGVDVTSIATEKAGILRAGKPVVCTQAQPPSPVVQAAAGLHAPLYRRGTDFDLLDDGAGELRFCFAGCSLTVPPPSLDGGHQHANLAAALAATALLNPDGLKHTDAIAEAIRQCTLAGRLQQISTSPALIVDVGHNALAATAVTGWFKARKQAGIICVLAMLADKPAESVVRVLDEVCGRWLCADSPGARGQTGKALAGRVRDALPLAAVHSAGSVEAAMSEAFSLAGETDTILVFGSFSAVSGTLAWQQNCKQHSRHDAAKITG